MKLSAQLIAEKQLEAINGGNQILLGTSMCLRSNILLVYVLFINLNCLAGPAKVEAAKNIVLGKGSNPQLIEQTIDDAIKLRNVDIIKAAARSTNPDTRIATLKKLSNSDKLLKIDFLIEALNESGNWREIKFSKGEDLIIQQQEVSFIASELERLGIPVERESLFQSEYRAHVIALIQKLNENPKNN